MAQLSEQQKMDLIIRAYAEGYNGDWETLLQAGGVQQEESLHPAEQSPTNIIPEEKQQFTPQQPKPTFNFNDFNDNRAQSLVRSYDPEAPDEMSLGEPVQNASDNLSHNYKRGGLKIANNMNVPEVDLDAGQYTDNYTKNYLYEEGGEKDTQDFDFNTLNYSKLNDGKIQNQDKDNDRIPFFIDRFDNPSALTDGSAIDPSFTNLERGIRYAESKNGKLMYNKQKNSTATGLYGQLFSEIEDTYPGTRKEFEKDIEAQTKYFEQLANKESGLIDNGLDLFQEYHDQLYEEPSLQNPKGKPFPYTPTELGALSNMLGRQGTREFLGYHLRDGKPLSEVFPKLYGKDKEVINKTPDDYIKEFNKGVYENTPNPVPFVDPENQLFNIEGMDDIKFENGGQHDDDNTLGDIKLIEPMDYNPFPLLKGKNRKRFFQILSEGESSSLDDSSITNLNRNSQALKLYNAWQDTGQPKLKYTPFEDLAAPNYNIIRGIEADDADGFVAELEHAHQFAGSKKEKTNLNQSPFSFDSLKQIAGRVLTGNSNLFLNEDQRKKNKFNTLKKVPEVLGTIKGLPHQINRFTNVKLPGHGYNPYRHQEGVEGVHDMPGAYGYEWGEGLERSISGRKKRPPTQKWIDNHKYEPSFAERMYNQMYNTSHEEKMNKYKDPNYFLEGYPETKFSKYSKIFDQEVNEETMTTVDNLPDDIKKKYPWMRNTFGRSYLQEQREKRGRIQ